MAAATPATTVAAFAGESLDALVWRAIGLGADAVERVLEANRDLAPLAQALPEGHLVAIPAIDNPAPETALIQLWD